MDKYRTKHDAPTISASFDPRREMIEGEIQFAMANTTYRTTAP